MNTVEHNDFIIWRNVHKLKNSIAKWVDMHSTRIYSSKIKGGPNTEITNIYYFLANKNITMKELQSHIAEKKGGGLYHKNNTIP